MATILFWQKPDFSGKVRQKRLLVASGHTLVARGLLAEP